MALAEYGNALNIDTDGSGNPILVDPQSGDVIAIYDRASGAWQVTEIEATTGDFDSVNTDRSTHNNAESDVQVFKDGITYYATHSEDGLIDSNQSLATVMSSVGSYLPRNAERRTLVLKGDLNTDSTFNLGLNNIDINVQGTLTATSSINRFWDFQDDSDIRLYGGTYDGQDLASSAVYARNSQRLRIEDIDIRDTSSHAINFTGDTVGESIIGNLRIAGPGGVGLQNVTLVDSFVYNISVGVTGSEGIFDSGAKNHYSNIVAYLCGANGMKLSGNGEHTVTNLRANDNEQAGLMVTVNGCTLSNLRLFKNGQGATGGNIDAGLRMDFASNNTITGLRASDQGAGNQTYGIGANQSDYNNYSGNVRGNRDGATNGIGANSLTNSLIT